jgi:predicted nucleic acid-binding Zn ribbon protein
MPYIFSTNAIYNYKKPKVEVIGTRGAGVQGNASIEVFDSHISFDTSSVTSSNARCIVDIRISDSAIYQTCFEMVASALKGELVTAGIECKIHSSGLYVADNRRAEAAKSTGEINSFEFMINGLEDCLSFVDMSSVGLMIVMGMLTRGLSCGLTSNSLSFDFFLSYEASKMIIMSAQKDNNINGIIRVHQGMLTAMAKAKTGMPKEMRKSIAKEWSYANNAHTFPSYPTIFLWRIFCTFVPISFPRYEPGSFHQTGFGIPLDVELLESIQNPDSIITDEHYSMMQKAQQYRTYTTRFDWILNFWTKQKDRSTLMTDKGTIVVLKKDGKHQEFYSVEDPAYNFTDTEAVDPNISGPIGKKFKELSLRTTGAWNIKHELKIQSGAVSESVVENLSEIPQHWVTWTNARVIDTTNNVVIKDGKQTPVKISRVNKYVLVAVKD